MLFITFQLTPLPGVSVTLLFAEDKCIIGWPSARKLSINICSWCDVYKQTDLEALGSSVDSPRETDGGWIVVVAELRDGRWYNNNNNDSCLSAGKAACCFPSRQFASRWGGRQISVGSQWHISPHIGLISLKKRADLAGKEKTQMKAAVDGRTTGAVPGIQSGLVEYMQAPPPSEQKKTCEALRAFVSLWKGRCPPSRLPISLWIHSNATIKAKICPPHTKPPSHGPLRNRNNSVLGALYTNVARWNLHFPFNTASRVEFMK